MEKGTPHCKLMLVKSLTRAGKIRATAAALASAAPMGFDFDGIVGVVLALTTADFYKSMTTHMNHQMWQDVYRTATSAGEVYLKLTVIDDVLVVSFKEL